MCGMELQTEHEVETEPRGLMHGFLDLKNLPNLPTRQHIDPQYTRGFDCEWLVMVSDPKP